MLDSAPVRDWFSAWLARFNSAATGSAMRIEWLLLLDQPPSIDQGEITDKGSINQRAVLQCRAELVEAAYQGVAKGLLLAPARD